MLLSNKKIIAIACAIMIAVGMSSLVVARGGGGHGGGGFHGGGRGGGSFHGGGRGGSRGGGRAGYVGRGGRGGGRPAGYHGSGSRRGAGAGNRVNRGGHGQHRPHNRPGHGGVGRHRGGSGRHGHGHGWRNGGFWGAGYGGLGWGWGWGWGLGGFGLGMVLGSWINSGSGDTVVEVYQPNDDVRSLNNQPLGPWWQNEPWYTDGWWLSVERTCVENPYQPGCPGFEYCRMNYKTTPGCDRYNYCSLHPDERCSISGKLPEKKSSKVAEERSASEQEGDEQVEGKGETISYERAEGHEGEPGTVEEI